MIGYLMKSFRGFWRKGVLIQCVDLINYMYDSSIYNARNTEGGTEKFLVTIRVHRCYRFEPYLLASLMEKLTKYIEGDITWS